MKKYEIMVLALVFLGCFSCAPKEESEQAPPPPKVSVYETVASEVPLYQEFVGQVYGFKDIGISARVEGYLEGIHFQEGFPVKKGDAALYPGESAVRGGCGGQDEWCGGR